MRVTSYDEATAATLARVAAACREGDGREPLDEAARLHLRNHGLHDAALWLSDDGFALARWHRGPHPQAAETAEAAEAAGAADHIELDLAVAPGARRQGQGRALLEAALAEDGPLPVTAWSHGDHPGATALAESAGFRRTRELLVLTRPLTDDVKPTVTGPVAGDAATSTHTLGVTHATSLRIRAWREGDADELLRVNAAAFAHHPEQGSMDAANLAERMAEPWFDPAGLLMAADSDGRLLGFHWTKVHDNGHGEDYVVAVDPASHGRGVGSALLHAGLDHLARTGCREVHLYVEADNAPALALYRGLGFTTDHTHVQYARP